LTGGLKEFDHTGYDLEDTSHTKEFKKFYKEWLKKKDIPKMRETKELNTKLEALLEKQENMEIEYLWLKKRNVQLEKRNAQLESGLKNQPEGYLSKPTYYVPLSGVVAIVLLLILIFVWVSWLIWWNGHW